MPGKGSFSERWLDNPAYNDWLVQCSGNRHRARCKVCMKDVDISNMGEAALKSHAKGTFHLVKIKLLSSVKQNPTMEVFFYSKSGSTPLSSITQDTKSSFIEVLPVDAKSNSVESSAQTQSVGASATHSDSTASRPLSSFVQSHASTSTEILWVLKTVASHLSFRSSEGISSLFHQMFPDSDIASKFACGKDKCSYICRFGIAPHFTELLQQDINACAEFVLLFDESMNSSTHNKQLDIHIRFWQTDNTVKTRFLTSEFMGHATAEQLLEKFMAAVGKLNHILKLISLL